MGEFCCDESKRGLEYVLQSAPTLASAVVVVRLQSRNHTVE